MRESAVLLCILGIANFQMKILAWGYQCASNAWACST
jgi:hypothetical protein